MTKRLSSSRTFIFRGKQPDISKQGRILILDFRHPIPSMRKSKNVAFVLRHSFVIRHSRFVIRLSSIVVSQLPKTATGKVLEVCP